MLLQFTPLSYSTGVDTTRYDTDMGCVQSDNIFGHDPKKVDRDKKEESMLV